MAMYYQGSSEIQASDGLQTLYLMNPNFVGYSDTQPNMLFLNSAAAAHLLNSSLMPHAPPQQLLGVPLSPDLSRPSPVLDRFHYNTWGLADTNMAQQQTPRGLSLTLSAHQNKPVNSPVIGPMNNPSSPSATVTDQSSGVNAMRSFVIGSKYLKAAQKLLDDVVNVGKRKIDRPESCRDKAKMFRDSVVTNNGGSGNRSVVIELTTAQRQEIQMKKAKLNSMLDEVEQRCRHYHNEMQMVVASFEQAAGIGSARTYTELALKTILKQFKCLKSTISAQIKELNNSLGEQEKKLETSRLDQLQKSAWRPQRGLPERAVSVLRAWLFQHFLHPYPKDSDKHMLAKQTGLTRSQVSNWFINARVRLWKPMVEEMYQEETQNQEHMDIPSKVGQENNRLMDSSLTEISASKLTVSPTRSSFQARAGFAELINSFNLPEKNPKKPRNATQDDSPSSIVSAEMEIKDANINRYHGHGMDRFSGADQQLEIGFQGNNFSLTLGLPPTETSHTHHQNFLSHRNFDFGSENVETGVELSYYIF